MSIKFIIDSASDYSEKHEDVIVMPLIVSIDGKDYLDGETLTKDEFYQFMRQSETLPKTSQITPVRFEEAYKKIKDNGDQAIVICVSSELSGTYQSAMIARDEYEDCIYVLDSRNASIGEQIILLRGLQLASENKSFEEIIDYLEKEKKQIHILALLQTLENLKKGGRISKSSAMIGELLNIKPVITCDDGTIKLLGKARGFNVGKNLLTKELQKGEGIDFNRPFLTAYSGTDTSLLEKYIESEISLWEGACKEVPIVQAGCAIGTYASDGAIIVAYFEK